MKLTPQIDIKLFNDYVEKKLVTRRPHPTADLYIWNYTPMVQYAKAWDDVTRQTRGLITDHEGNVIARPFSKFFNYGEYEGELPNEPFDVSEKMDGSLGILYWDFATPALATRGSFESEQAKVGTELLKEYIASHGTGWMEGDVTYLFEIIYPDNRIVVDYGKDRRLVLLAAIVTKTGKELDLNDVDFDDKVVFKQNVVELASLAEEEIPNSEGYVVRFKNSGLRLKLKFSEYVRLHRILTETSSTIVWQVVAVKAMQELGLDAKQIGVNLHIDTNEVATIMEKGGLAELLEGVPDEFYDWLHKLIAELTGAKDKLVDEARDVVEKSDGNRRKLIMLTEKNKAVQAMAFAFMDGKEPMAHGHAWRTIKPKYSKPFKEDIDS